MLGFFFTHLFVRRRRQRRYDLALEQVAAELDVHLFGAKI